MINPFTNDVLHAKHVILKALYVQSAWYEKTQISCFIFIYDFAAFQAFLKQLIAHSYLETPSWLPSQWANKLIKN